MVSQKEADRYLYRGVSDAMHKKNGGRLVPKKTRPFIGTVPLSQNKLPKLKLNGSFTVGASKKNETLLHQLYYKHQGKTYKTSGISTTPHFSRAVIYARGRKRKNIGVVYMIDRKLLAEFGVIEHIVADTVPKPKIPKDAEVILATANGDILPVQVVVETVLLPKHKELTANNQNS